MYNTVIRHLCTLLSTVSLVTLCHHTKQMFISTVWHSGVIVASSVGITTGSLSDLGLISCCLCVSGSSKECCRGWKVNCPSTVYKYITSTQQILMFIFLPWVTKVERNWRSRMCSLSHRMWTVRERKEWNGFQISSPGHCLTVAYHNSFWLKSMLSKNGFYGLMSEKSWV